MASLANQTISSTYDGLIKTSSDNAVPVSGVQALEDGSGNALALSVGRSGNGVTVSGNLAVDTNTLYVDAANNRVGIGTASPETDLEIENTNPTIIVDDDRVGGGLLRFSAGSSANTYIQAGTELTSGSSANIIFGSIYGANEWMRIDSSGNVGIGVTPSNTLHIYKNASMGSPASFTAANAGLRIQDNFNSMYFDGNAIISNTTGVFEVGTTESAPIALFTNATERMRIDSSGNVGIGKSPDTKLHLYAGDATFEASTASNANIVLKSNNANSKTAGVYFLDQSTYQWLIKSDSTNSLVFNKFQGGTGEAMRIDSSGNVGIGVTPSSWGSNFQGLQVKGGSITSQSDDYLYLFQNAYWDGTNNRAVATGESSRYEQSFGQHIWSNASSVTAGSVVSFTERMRITSGGDVLVGTQSSLHSEAVFHIKQNNTSSGNNACAAMQNQNAASGSGVYTVVFLNSVGSITGSIGQTSSSTSYNTSSDYRLKENVVEMTGALDRVDALKPSRFNFIADPNTTVDGFIAHEVAEVVPEAISGEKDEVDEEGNPIYQGIDQSKIVPLLVGAIKELRAEIETLKSQLNA